MKRTLTVFSIAIISYTALSQSHMRIHHKGGGHSDVAIEQIDSITFVDGSDLPDDEVSLTGSWLWGDTEAGYYELLTFNEDKTYTGYDNYFTHDFDTMTYGWYMQAGSMLTLQSNGYGYNRRYNWFVMGLTENALDVMTKMGRFVYYRLQPEIIQLQENGEPMVCTDGERIVFADGVITRIDDGKLKGIAKGTTYIEIYNAKKNTTRAYKVVVG